MKLEDLSVIHCDQIEVLEISPECFLAIPYPAPLDEKWKNFLAPVEEREGFGLLAYQALRNDMLAPARDKYLGIGKCPHGYGSTRFKARLDLVRFLEQIAPADETTIRYGITVMLSAWLAVMVVFEQECLKTNGNFDLTKLMIILDQQVQERLDTEQGRRYLACLEQWGAASLQATAQEALRSKEEQAKWNAGAGEQDGVTLEGLSECLDFNIVTFKGDEAWESVLVHKVSEELLNKYHQLSAADIDVENCMRGDTWRGFLTRCYLKATWSPYGRGATAHDSYLSLQEKLSEVPMVLTEDYAVLISQMYSNWLLALLSLKGEYMIDVPMTSADNHDKVKRSIVEDATAPHNWFTSHVNANVDKRKG